MEKESKPMPTKYAVILPDGAHDEPLDVLAGARPSKQPTFPTWTGWR